MFRKRRPGTAELLAATAGRRRVAQATIAGLAVFGALAACSGSDGQDLDSGSDLIVDVEPTVYQFDPNDSSSLAGVSTDPLEISQGDCFNDYLFRDRADFLQNVTTVVRCSTPHDREAYFVTDHPAGEDERFPLNDDLTQWAEATCLKEFEEFVGREYVMSLLEIGTITPGFGEWTDEGIRTLVCYVYPAEGGRLRESVRNSGI